MAKVFQFTMMLELGDGAPHPEDWDWWGAIAEIPGIQGFSLIDAEERPYASMEEDPITHTRH